jgi:hypothetical protein
MPILLENTGEDNELHPTLFGFKTRNGVASKLLNFIYIVVMVVALAFAYHALNLILPDWNSGIIFLAALAVVGLPYCIKIIMYGRDVFEYKYAVLCILISLLPTIFDFIGFYSETSIRSALQKTKFEVLEKVNYFDRDARSVLTKRMLELEKEYNGQLTELDKNHNNSLKTIKDKINEAEQLFIDESKGVPGRTTSGTAGMGPKARELEAEVRKAKAASDIQLKELEQNKAKESERITKDYQTKLASYEQGIKAIDNLMATNEEGEGLVFDVNKAHSFNELADTAVKLNSAINVVSSKLNVEPQYVKFETRNVIDLSFSALMRADVTAIVCLLLALLLEVVDTIIVYMVRGVKIKKKKKVDEPVNNIRETIHYKF